MELQKQNNSLQTYRKPLIDALIKYDRTEVNNILALYKAPNGSPDYSKLLEVKERLPELIQKDYKQTCAVLVVALTKAFSAMNLSRPMNADQIMELAETIMDSSGEDFLALEDVLIFLQGLVRGKYGALYESMDIPKFMDKFEIYREERHQALMNHRYEQTARFKQSRVNTEIISEDKNREALKDYLKSQK